MFLGHVVANFLVNHFMVRYVDWFTLLDKDKEKTEYL